MLRASSTILTKTKYMIGLQCPKSLWVMFHEPEKISEVSAETQNRFDQGHIVGAFAKKLFSDGIEVKQDSFKENIKLSKELISKRKPLFEAGFLNGNVFSRADILNPHGKDDWDIIEVKSSTQVKNEHIHDVSFQRFCYIKAGLKIRKCFLMHINNEYVRNGEIEPKELFVKEDITKFVDKASEGMEDRINALLHIIANKTSPKHCAHPSTCPLEAECWGFLPKNSVFSLYRGGKKCLELYNNGIMAIKDIPENFNLGSIHKIQFKCAITGKSHVNIKELKSFLSRRKYPLHFLDFETYSVPIPLFDGVRPYQQIPFQFSLHVQRTDDAKPEHYTFLADEDGEDPRKPFMDELKKIIEDEGSIIAYNDVFEKGVLKSLTRINPEYKNWVDSILPRFVDLLVPFRKFHYYHPDQNGSASIKKVLPAIIGRSYDDMEIAAGGDASALFLAMTMGNLSKEEVKKIRDNLEKYCALDTEAMFLILSELERTVKLDIKPKVKT